MDTPNEDPKLLPSPDDENKDTQKPKGGEITAKPEALENPEVVDKTSKAIQEIQKETKQKINDTLEDPAQNLVALADALHAAGFEFETLSPEEMKNAANLLSTLQKGKGEGVDASFDFNAKLLKFLEQGNKSNEQLEEIRKQLAAQYSAKEMSGVEGKEMIEKFEELISQIEKNGADNKGIGEKFQKEIQALKKEVKELKKSVGEKGFFGKMKDRINRLGLRIAIILFLIGGLFALYQNWRIQRLQKDVEKHAAVLLGKDFTPDDSFKDVLDRGKEWEKKYEEEHGKWDIQQKDWEKEREKFLEEAKKKHGELTALALDVDRLTQALKEAKKGTEEWTNESKEAEESILKLATKIAQLQSDLLKALGNAWLAYGIAAKDQQYGMLFTEKSRKSFADAVNELLKQIEEEISAQSKTSSDVRRPWGEAKQGGRKCLDSVNEALEALSENDFPFKKGQKEKIQEAIGKMR